MVGVRFAITLARANRMGKSIHRRAAEAMSLTGLEQYLDTHPDPRIVRIGVAGAKHGEQFGKFAAVVARGA